jgi:hypothetical protein
MDRAVHNVRLLVERLNQLGYEFAFESYESPSAQSRTAWRKVESTIVPMPLSLRAWWDVESD